MRKGLVATIIGFLRDAVKFIACVGICEAVGAIGAVFTRGSLYDWYEPLVKPALNPPSEIFAPVWLVMYFLMGTALFLVLKREQYDRKDALVIFFIQLFFNALWSPVFFGGRSIFGGMLILIFLVPTAFITMVRFRRISPLAGWLFLPYVCWLFFAAYLNASLLTLNS